MAKTLKASGKAGTKTRAPVVNDDDELDELDELMEPAVELTQEQRDLAFLLDELGANPKATVTIYRDTGKRGVKGAYIMQYGVSTKSLPEVMDYLRDAKRGGEFRFYVSDGTTMKANQLVIVEPPTPEEVRQYEERQRANNPVHYQSAQATPQNQGSSEIALLLAKMNEDQVRRDEQYRQDQERRDAQAKADREAADKRMERELERQDKNNQFMLQMMKSDKRESMGITEIITLAKTLNGNDRKESDLDILIKGLSLRDQLIGDTTGGKEESTVNTAIKHLGAPLAQLLLTLNKPTLPNPMQRRISLPTTSEPVKAPVSTLGVSVDSETLDSEPKNPEEIALLFAEIVEAAEKQADPAPYADKLIDTFGEDVCADIVADDDKYAAVLQHLGAEIVEKHRLWFDKLRDIMLDSLYEDDPSGATHEETSQQPDHLSDKASS